VLEFPALAVRPVGELLFHRRDDAGLTGLSKSARF
jgi:hypothetical protein